MRFAMPRCSVYPAGFEPAGRRRVPAEDDQIGERDLHSIGLDTDHSHPGARQPSRTPTVSTARAPNHNKNPHIPIDTAPTPSEMPISRVPSAPLLGLLFVCCS